MDQSFTRKSFSFSEQLGVGDEGEVILAAFLRRRGWEVEDVTSDPLWRRRDIDLLVNGRMVEVKTDTHRAVNMFLELSVGDRPGCVWVSRAEVWCYMFPRAGRFYLVELPKLQHWCFRHGHEYPEKHITSREGKRSWGAVGIAVPLVTLELAGVAHGFELSEAKESEGVA